MLRSKKEIKFTSKDQPRLLYVIAATNLIYLYPFSFNFTLMGNFSIADFFQLLLFCFFILLKKTRKQLILFYRSPFGCIVYLVSLSLFCTAVFDKDISLNLYSYLQYQFILWLLLPVGIITIAGLSFKTIFQRFINFYLLLYLTGICLNLLGVEYLIYNGGANRYYAIWQSAFHFNVFSFGFFITRLLIGKNNVLNSLGIVFSTLAVCLTVSRTSIAGLLLISLIYFFQNITKGKIVQTIFFCFYSITIAVLSLSFIFL